MKCLLDTHILLWSLLQPERLSIRTAEALQDTGNELWISPISIWEILLLAEKQRIVVASADTEAWIRDVLARVPLRQAALNHEVSLKSRSVDLEHVDPADRFIAATATVYDLILLTEDERLLQSTQLHTMH